MEVNSFLEKGLSSNSELKNKVLITQNAEYLKYLDELFEELSRSSCKGIQVKVNETSDLFRFQALVSELEFARYFLRNKMQVMFLPNDVFQGRRAPDMIVSDNSKEYFVEVKNIQLDDEAWNFGTKVAQILNGLGMSFMVVIKSSNVLATPAYRYQTKDQKEQSCEASLEEFKEKLKTISLDSSIASIETTIAKIELHQTDKGKSYLGISTMQEAISEPPEYKERIRYDIIQKSKKREDWLGDELTRFYILAIDDNSMFFPADAYNVELFGHATFYVSPLPVPEIKLDTNIHYALKHGWKEYLVKMCVLRNDRSVIPENKRGMLFTEPAMKNVTAILVKHRRKFLLFANPFADEKINNPNILVELPDCHIGWE